jgi:hypothetical protein
MEESSAEALASALVNNAPVSYLREHFGHLLRSNDLLTFEDGVRMQPVAMAIQQACGEGWVDLDHALSRLHFLVTECGIDLNAPLTIYGCIVPYLGGRTLTVPFEPPPGHETEYVIHSTPLSRALCLMNQRGGYYTGQQKSFVMEMIHLGADPQQPFYHQSMNPRNASEEFSNNKTGQSLLWMTLCNRESLVRDFTLSVFLLERGNGFLPTDHPPITVLASRGDWDYTNAVLRALRPFYSPTGTLFNQSHFAPTADTRQTPLHFLAAWAPQNLNIVQEAFHLLVHEYGQWVTERSANGRTPLEEVGRMNQLDGLYTPSCVWLRQAFAHELEKLQVRHSAIALHSVFDREGIPLEIQNHIAQASLDSNRRYLMSSAHNALKSVYSKRNT